MAQDVDVLQLIGKIYPLPELRTRIKESVSNERLIVFIGAGVSKLYDCLLWNEMAIDLVNKLRDANILTHAERDVLLQETNTNPRKAISICYSKCSNSNNLHVYEKLIKDATEIKDISKAKDIYKKIFSIKATAHMTTNIDVGLKRYVSSIQLKGGNTKTYNCTLSHDQERIRQVNYNIFKDGVVIYLHGNIENITECILPVEKYLSHYSENNSFLNEIFLRINSMKGMIIFLGYGLNEWDIIERIYKIKNFSNETKAYLLSPIFTHELTQFCLEVEYYRSFGVEPIPYIIDSEGYEKLNFVLDNLAKAVDRSMPSPYEIFSKIEEI
jgi:NAD-dependent SIR2 family protein deacetylase